MRFLTLLSRSLFFLFLITNNAWSQAGARHSYESFANVLKPKNHQLKLTNSLFQTTAYTDYNGSKQNVGSNDSYSRIENEFIFRKNMAKYFEGGLFARYRSQNSELTDNTGIVHSNSKTGIDSIGFQLRHTFVPVENIRYTIEGGARFATYRNTTYDPIQPYQELALGDAVHEIFGGGAFSYETTSKNIFTGRVHLNYPTSKQSAELKYDSQFAVVWEKIALIAGVGGVYSLGQDKYSDDKNSKPKIYNGATRMYNSINRAYVAPYLGANIGFNQHWRIEGKVSSIVTSYSYDLGNEYGVNLVYNTDRADTTRQLEKDDKFKTYNVEATVVKISPRSKFVRIDKGLAQDVEKGMRADIFDFDYQGGNKLLASGVVMEVTADAAVVKIMEIYGKIEIKTGHVVRLMEL
ncbi:MAG: hypothetical protein ACOYL6_10075 [Bacteriovoracaceae bacterium]